MSADTYYISAMILAVGSAVNFAGGDKSGGFIFGVATAIQMGLWLASVVAS